MNKRKKVLFKFILLCIVVLLIGLIILFNFSSLVDFFAGLSFWGWILFILIVLLFLVFFRYGLV